MKNLMKRDNDFKLADFSLDVKELSDKGTFSGYVAIFDTVDQGDDVIMKGAFKNSLKGMKSSGRPMPLLWQHRTDKPIGSFTKLVEDEKGLFFEATLLKDTVALAGEAHALLEAKIVSGMSIGYRTVKGMSEFDPENGIRYLKELDLKEGSLVTFPMHDDARVDAIKMKLSNGADCSVREYEHILREAGMSKTKAARFANAGFRSLQGEPEEKGDGLKELMNAIDAFELPSMETKHHG